MTFEFDDKNLAGLTESAKNALREHLNDYALAVVKEASLIEEGARAENAKREITATHVLHAATSKKYAPSKKTRISTRVLKLASSISCLLVGLFFDSQGFQGQFGKMLVFILFLIIAIVTVTITTIKED